MVEVCFYKRLQGDPLLAKSCPINDVALAIADVANSMTVYLNCCFQPLQYQSYPSTKVKMDLVL